MNNEILKNITKNRFIRSQKKKLYGADLSGADLRKADLSGADLRKADLSGANLCEASLYGANLRGANLHGANLTVADLMYTDLECSNLYEADLRFAILYKANLKAANLSGANLCYASFHDSNLSGADLSNADLSGADLFGANLNKIELNDTHLNHANLCGTIMDEETEKYLIMSTNVCPQEGSFIGYKKANGKIVKLLILEDAKRSNATSNKCRCDKAKVLGIYDKNHNLLDVKKVSSDRDEFFIYEVGEIVTCKNFDENRWNECSYGIHFFLLFESAVDY